MTDDSVRSDVCPRWDTMAVRNGDIELRFKLREQVSEELAASISEHGILQPPLILQLTPELQAAFNTRRPYLCIDGHSRLMEVPEEAEVECLVVTWSELQRLSEARLKKAGLEPSALTPGELILTYILTLHAAREPLPRSAYVRAAEELMKKGISLRQAAALLGVPRSSLHRWMTKEPLDEEDLEAEVPQRQGSKQCGLCGEWIKRGARGMWFHSSCHEKVVELIEGAKEKAKGGDNDE
jgi:hypothetical protein